MKQGLETTTVRGFLDALASREPTPGGGGAAAVGGAMAAALVSMVCNLTIGRPKFAAVEAGLVAVRDASEQARARLLELAEADARAYGGVAVAYRQPRGTPEERALRTEAIQRALVEAAQPPLAVMDLSRSLLGLALQAATHGNPAVASDAGVAADLAVAATRAAALMVRANLAELTDPALVAQLTARIAAAEAGLTADLDRVVGILHAKLAPKVTS